MIKGMYCLQRYSLFLIAPCEHSLALTEKLYTNTIAYTPDFGGLIAFIMPHYKIK